MIDNFHIETLLSTVYFWFFLTFIIGVSVYCKNLLLGKIRNINQIDTYQSFTSVLGCDT